MLVVDLLVLLHTTLDMDHPESPTKPHDPNFQDYNPPFFSTQPPKPDLNL